MSTACRWREIRAAEDAAVLGLACDIASQRARELGPLVSAETAHRLRLAVLRRDAPTLMAAIDAAERELQEQSHAR